MENSSTEFFFCLHVERRSLQSVLKKIAPHFSLSVVGFYRNNLPIIADVFKALPDAFKTFSHKPRSPGRILLPRGSQAAESPGKHLLLLQYPTRFFLLQRTQNSSSPQVREHPNIGRRATAAETLEVCLPWTESSDDCRHQQPYSTLEGKPVRFHLSVALQTGKQRRNASRGTGIHSANLGSSNGGCSAAVRRSKAGRTRRSLLRQMCCHCLIG